MLFNSIEFAIFLPIVFVLYWFVAHKNLHFQNILLLVASYVFYGWWDWRFLSLIMISSVVDYWVGVSLSQNKNTAKRKRLLWISILVNIGFLGFFKYFNFFIESFAEAFTFFGQPIGVGRLHIILPVGISFYTFQTLSYTIDIYKQKLQPTKDPIAFFAFVSFFPQLVAGPIERASHLLPQFYQPRNFKYQAASTGLKQMLWGFFMKIAVADRLALYVDTVYNNIEMHSSSTLITATLFFAIQIYADFAGYSLIAIGCARLFDFDLMENFRRPYFATSFKDFWARWHISLSTWFRDYVYIPLGGSRKNKIRTNLNLFITFVVSGLWHGANWTFLIWGALHGCYQIAEKSTDKIKLPYWLKMIIILLLTCFAWIFFRAATVGDAFLYISHVFVNTNKGFYFGDKGIFAFSLVSISILWFHDFKKEYYPNYQFLHHPQLSVRLISAVVLVAYILALGVFDNSQFIYFQF